MTIECPKCQFDNPNDTAFCGKCGTNFDIDKGPTKTLETPTEELTRGSVFAGRYEIIEELGKGGMGKVYRVEDTKIKQEIALKLIRPEIAADKKTIERFKNELKTARNIRHKNVCGMFDLGEEKGSHFITMEYISGQDLKGLIRQTGQLTVGKAVSIAKQICDGLEEAHSLGIVHRDLKPNNIMIDRGGNARIMDFGIARAVKGKSITGSGVMIGTPQYMSPEQVEGKDVDQRSDIYSLGIILYEMLTDRVPFEGDTPLTVGVKQKTETPKDPKDFNERISDDLNRLILKCLEKDKENRYQSAVELRSELEKIEHGLPTTERIEPKKKPLTSREYTVQLNMKKLFFFALAVFAVVIIGLILWSPWSKMEESAPISSEKPSLAVLPFEDFSQKKDQEHLCLGLAAELIYRLNKVQNLWVPARASSFSFRGSDIDIQEVGNRLNVKSVLVGTLQKAENKLRISVELINVADNNIIWSETYERDEGDIFDLEDELALVIVEKLKVNLLGEEKAAIVKRYTENVEAYNLYLAGRFFWNKRTADGTESALEYFEKAIEKDSEFALAYAGMADCFIILPFYGNFLPRDEYPKALEAASTALEIDESLAEAHTSLAYLKGFYEWNWPEAEKEFKTAIKLNPNYANGHHWYGLLLSAQGRTQEAIDELRKAIELDPLSHIIINNYGDVLYHAHLYDQAIEQYRKALEIAPKFSQSVKGIGLVYLEKGMFEESIMELEQRSSYSIYAYMSLGREDEALALLEHFKELSNRQRVNPIIFLNTYLGLGDFDKAFENLEKMYKERSPYIVDKVLPEPFYDRMRSDPRYKSFLQKMSIEK